jgi:hypothetical protein
MPILTENPVVILEPEVQYDRLFLSLAIGGVVVDGSDVDSNVSLSMRRYRKLADGSIEFAPREKGDESISISRVFEEAQNDAALAQCAGTIFAALGEFIAAKGL